MRKRNIDADERTAIVESVARRVGTAFFQRELADLQKRKQERAGEPSRTQAWLPLPPLHSGTSSATPPLNADADADADAMSTDIGGRAVLKPAGNVARSNLRKASKPPSSPGKPPLISPPNSLPPSPRPPARAPSVKPNSPLSKLSPRKTPSLSPLSLDHPHHQEPALGDLADDGGPKPAVAAEGSPPDAAADFPCHLPHSPLCKLEDDGSNPSIFLSGEASPSRSEFSRSGSSSCSSDLDLKRTSKVDNLSAEGVRVSHSLSASGKKLQNALTSSLDASHSCSPKASKAMNPRIVLTKSTSEVFQRSSATSKVRSKPSNQKSLNRLGSLSFDESSLASIVAAKKAAAKQLSEQRKQKVSEYGRKQGKAGRVAPEIHLAQTSHLAEQQRCRFISAQSDPVFVDYHDKEWGVPVHDDRVLFELLTLAGFQAELNWTAILHNRDAFRTLFVGFDTVAVSLFCEKHILALEADKSLCLPSGKVRGVVNNARKILEVALEYGSLDEYLWGFVNRQPMINNYRYPKQVPVKTSKAEFISKDLVKRGFRFVGPTIIYSFMQSSGMTNDHLVQCFRHIECTELSRSFSASSAGELPDVTQCSLAGLMHPLDFVLEDSAELGDDSKMECHSEQLEISLKGTGLDEKAINPTI